jgi:ribose transport system permease protein
MASLPAFVLRNRAIFVAYGLVLALFVAGTIHSLGYAAPTNIRSLLIYGSTIGIAAFGQSLCILTGGIDLSIPWTMTGAAVLCAKLGGGGGSDLAEVLVLIALLAVAVGIVNGVIVAYASVPPIIMTLGMNGVLQGLVLVYTNGGGSATAPPGLEHWLRTDLFGVVPKQVLIWAAITVVATLILTRGTLGKRLYAIGTNANAAHLAGNNVRRTLVIPYVISAVSGALAGVLLMGFSGGAYFTLGDPYLFATAAAVAVGGASILGGTGHYLGTVAGALTLTLIVSLLTLLNVGQAWLNIAYGLILLLALVLATPRARRA